MLFDPFLFVAASAASFCAWRAERRVDSLEQELSAARERGSEREAAALQALREGNARSMQASSALTATLAKLESGAGEASAIAADLRAVAGSLAA